jgi:CheY-like chemotaxis protein
MDHMMPGMDGVETTQRLRSSGYDAPIVALTANALTGQADMFLQNGFNEFISKPIDTRQLNHVLNKLIRDKQPPEVIEAARWHKMNDNDETKITSPVIDALRAISDIDVTAALAVLGGMAEVYENTVKLSARLMPATVEKMSKALDNNDLNGFAIEVHGLKGVIRSIGASEIASKAGKLEAAAIAGNRAFCYENYPSYKIIINEFLHRLNHAIAQEPKTERECVSDGELIEAVKAAKEAAEGYDAMQALKLLKPLVGCAFNHNIAENIEKAVSALEEFNCPEAVAALTEIEGTMGSPTP